MSTKKVIFVAFAIEDERSRDFLKGQSLNTNSPFEYIDMSVREAYESDWKNKVSARIKRSHGVIALVSKNSINSTGQKWEIQCAQENNVPLIGIRISSSDSTVIPNVSTVAWTWDNIKNFIDRI